jgi:23S rRNA (pseudouridine1915-N3)-methyltransferase
MIVHIVAVGRVRDASVRAACDGYLKRARRGLRITVREVPEAGRRARTPVEARRIEGDRLAAVLPQGAAVVALTRDGASYSSPQFAELVDRWRLEARDVALVIGGAFGLSGDLVARSTLRVALSALTLPHELARLVLLEQLYRAGTILRGEPYHKGPLAP